MGPTLESRVSGPLDHRGVLVRAGYGRSIMFCYVMYPDTHVSTVMSHDIMGHGQSGESETRFTTGVGLPTVNLAPPLQS